MILSQISSCSIQVQLSKKIDSETLFPKDIAVSHKIVANEDHKRDEGEEEKMFQEVVDVIYVRVVGLGDILARQHDNWVMCVFHIDN